MEVMTKECHCYRLLVWGLVSQKLVQDITGGSLRKGGGGGRCAHTGINVMVLDSVLVRMI